jgi:DNA-binding response OmpR family regulator
MTAALVCPILVIEADLDLGQGIVEQLIADNHPAKLVQSARHAVLFAERHPPSLVVIGELDAPHAPLMLLRHIRRSDPADRWPVDVPVIMLSANTDQADLLRAFDAGADDILARPPTYLELRARLRAILRRTTTSSADSRLRIRSLTIDTSSREVTINGRAIHLRRLEYDLLAYLASEPHRVFHKQELLINLWGYSTPGTTRTLETHASRLRRKLGGNGERWIINVHGVGYRLI